MTQTKVEAPFVENNRPFRNLIINGDMQVAQRATAATAAANAFNTIDRFKALDVNSNGAYTTEQHAMTEAELGTTGQRFALEANCTTADGSIAANHYAAIYTNIEAQNCMSLLYGTSNAKTITLSFWVKSNLTGTFCVAFYKDDTTTYWCTKEYTIAAADTWEKKTLTVKATEGSTTLITNSAGHIDQDNGVGIALYFGLVSGSNYHGSADVWETGTLFTSNQTNFLSSTSNNFYLTGVQLEVGDAATDFEYVPFDVQLQRCQRYYYVHTSGAESNTSHVGLFNAYSSSNLQISIFHPVQMRAAASADFVQGTNFYIAYGNGGSDSFDGFDLGSEGNKNGSALYTSSKNVSVTQASPYFVRVYGSTGATARVAFDAEL